MSKLTNLSATLVLLAALLVVSGCQAKDRAGGNADTEATELRFAITGDPGTQIAAWADEVDQLSNGTLAVTFVRDAHAGQPDYEAAMIADVRAGTVDMAWVGARAFDKDGLTSFQPLLAPMLIDSLELEGKVFDAGIPQQLLPTLDQIDLVGVGILPGPIRKVLGVRKPFTAAADFRGQTVGIQASGVAEQTFHTLGAITKAVPTGAKLTGLDAYDQQLSSIHGNHYAARAKYVTGNLNLWPRPLVIIANQDVYQKLTDDQRAIMATAAKHAIPVAMEAERSAEANAILGLCKAGLRFAQSSDADLAAVQKAIDPVYSAIRNKAGNLTRLDQIAAVKNALHRAPDTADCTNTSTDQPAATRYDGTYRQKVNYSTVKPCPDDDVPPAGVWVSEIVFDNGSLRMWTWAEGHEYQREIGWDGTYTFFKDQLQVEDSAGPLTVDFVYAGTTLTLSNMRGGTCGDARAWTTEPWIRQ